MERARRGTDLPQGDADKAAAGKPRNPQVPKTARVPENPGTQAAQAARLPKATGDSSPTSWGAVTNTNSLTSYITPGMEGGRAGLLFLKTVTLRKV